MRSRNQLTQLIHIGKNQLALDDETYRLLLKSETDKTSCKQMSIKELEQVLSAMEQRGFKRKVNNSKKPFKRRLSPKSGKSKNTIIDKCRAIWITLAKQGFVRDGSEAALDKYTQRILKNQQDKVDCIAWCDAYQAAKVLEALKRWHRRVMIDHMKEKGWTVPMNDRTGKPMGYEPVSDAYLRMMNQVEN